MHPAYLVLFLGTLGACDSSAPVDRAPTAVIQATASQTREDIAAGGRFQVVLKNTGTVPLTVTSVQLVSPGFHELPATPTEVQYSPADLISLPAPYGSVRCDADVLPLTVRLTVDSGKGPGRAEVPLASPNGLMKRIHDKDCAQEHLFAQVRAEILGLAASGPGQPPAVRGRLRLNRAATTQEVVVDGASGSVLFDVQVPAGRLLRGASRSISPCA